MEYKSDMINIFSAKKRYLPAAALLLSACVLAVLSALSESGKGGPLLFQAHFTCQAPGLDMETAEKILSGNIPPAREVTGLSGSLTVYADRAVAPSLKKEYPALVFKECDAVTSPPSADRGALLISDIRGVVPSMKLLPVDGRFPWGKMETDYSIKGDAPYTLMKKWAAPFERESHFTVVQTGVTAMTRAFIRAVDKHGDILRPVRGVRQVTSPADLAVTSNEVSFSDPCTYPLPDRMLFCSPRDYFPILKEAGFDLIELTGNHNNDYGTAANLASIERYRSEGMKYFGGGRNSEEAGEIRYMKIKGVTLAFAGFNQWGPPAAWAAKDSPGANRLTSAKFDRTVTEAVKNADIVFISVQWGNENDPVPHKEQMEFFHRAARMGAHIMLSSSAHRAMGMEFYDGRFISYGLGNFLFDQMQTLNHRRGLMARHHFIGKHHVQTELIPYLIYGYSEPHIVSGREARGVFDYIFRYSLGPVFGR